MWNAFYNSEGVGDVLMLTREEIPAENVRLEKTDHAAYIYRVDTGDLVGVNIFSASNLVDIQGSGPVDLSLDQVQVLNDIIGQEAGQTLDLVTPPHFVVGYVESCQAHPDSDHLSVTQTLIGEESLQIVCGASNISQGLTVLVAKPGAVMPSGMIIRPGVLRGIQSQGMICSTRELGLSHIEDYPGIWELDPSLVPGTPLNQVLESYQAGDETGNERL